MTTAPEWSYPPGSQRQSLLGLVGPIPTDQSGVPPAKRLDELRNVQGNILHPHGRRFALHTLLVFRATSPARTWISRIANDLTTAADELLARTTCTTEPRPSFLSLALSYRGLRAAGLPRTSSYIADESYRQGMAARRSVLSDPPRLDRETPYRDGCDAMLVIADDVPDNAWAKFRRLFADAPVDGVDVVGVEIGQRLTNQFGQDVEHFGYVDGTSQPLFFQCDVDRETRRQRNPRWSPGFPPRQVLVPCPGGGYGSYLVFRKLEQNVAAFAAAKRRLAARLGGLDDPAVAGARIIGRYEDGRPFGLRDQLGSVLPVENGFLYDTEPPACPIGSHVRMVNPRTARSRATAIARRGMPYGTPVAGRAWSPTDPTATGGVGLLFIAYMADIGAQYEAIQIAANGTNADDRDPLIGQGPHPSAAYGTTADGQLVRLRGGEYFFVPSPAFLRGASDAQASTDAYTRPVMPGDQPGGRGRY